MKTVNAPTCTQLQQLADLCSSSEWDRVITSDLFLAAMDISLAETEDAMSALLGRKISVTQPSAKNPGDEKL